MKSTRGTDKVSPAIALALLTALRASDTPAEVIEDESFRISLPRRLGLNEVVDRQMRRYSEINDRRGTISADEFASLLGLIDRRPDAGAIFAAAGRELGEARFSPPGAVDRTRDRLTPAGMKRRRLLRGMTEVARELQPGSSITPVSEAGEDGIDIREPPLAMATIEGAGCDLLTGALEVCVARLAGNAHGIDHPRCVARGDDLCRWTVARAEPDL